MNIGLYFHVPFCNSRCTYCDFYSTTQGEALRNRYVPAAVAELSARREEHRGHGIATVYLGGGTPSCLGGERIARLLEWVRGECDVRTEAEITVEANPDDITPQRVARWLSAGVNRVSLGVQTLDDEILKQLNRRHTAQQAVQAVQTLRAEGIRNISVDLIYGLPAQTLDGFRCDLQQVLSLPVSHLSAYSLMVEGETPLAHRVRRGEVSVADEEVSCAMFRCLIEETGRSDFDHYEISNFARPGFRSKHNSSYWNGTPYIGIGPGAHSFDGRNRRFNRPDLSAYLRNPSEPPCETECLTAAERANEQVMVSLRTREGIDLRDFALRHGETALQSIMTEAAPFLRQNLLQLSNGRLSLTREGIFVSDMVMSQLMTV